MVAYATVTELSVKWRALSIDETLAADAHLEEGSALLRRLVAGLDAGLAAGTIDPLLVRKILTDAVLRVMRNPSGANSQTVGPEAATFSGLNAKPEITFTDAEIGLVTPASAQLSAKGSAIGTATMGRPDWAVTGGPTWIIGNRC